MLLRAQKTFEAYGRLVAALGLYLMFPNLCLSAPNRFKLPMENL